MLEEAQHKIKKIEKTLEEMNVKTREIDQINEVAKEKMKKYSKTQKAELESVMSFRQGFEAQLQQINITLQALNTRDYLHDIQRQAGRPAPTGSGAAGLMDFNVMSQQHNDVHARIEEIGKRLDKKVKKVKDQHKKDLAQYMKLMPKMESKMKSSEETIDRILTENIEMKQVSQTVQGTQTAMQEALRKINVFQELMEDEDFSDSLDKLKNQVERQKRDH